VGVIFVYYGVLLVTQNLTKGGQIPAIWARWLPNIVVAALGIVAFRWSSLSVGHDILLPDLGRWFRASSGRAQPPSTRARATATDSGGMGLVRLLDRYVARRYLSVATLSFFALLGIYYISTAIDKSERLFKGQATGAMLLEYFYYSTPQFIAYIVPVAALVAALATIGGLTRSSELVVIRACGVSLYRTAAPLFILALVWSVGLFVLDDRVLAPANRKAEALADRIRGNLPAANGVVATPNWFVGADDRIYYYTGFDVPSQTVFGVSVFEMLPDQSRLSSHTAAASAVFAGGVWRATDGWVQRFPTADSATRESFRGRTIPLPPPARFAGPVTSSTDLMTFSELRRHVAELETRGANRSESLVRLQSRIAFPLVTVVMTLLGVPFGSTIGRRGALYGVALALVLGAMYWLLNTFFVAVGEAGLLQPALAAWATNLLFLSLAGYAMLTART
jgi:LPS export ABC transporter permease LptG